MTGSDGDTTEHTIPKLTNDTTYTFQLRAVNDGGYSTESNSASAMPKLPDPPGTPQNLLITAGDEKVLLNWDPPNTGGEPEAYEYRQSDDGGTNWSDWAPIPGNGSTSSYIIEKLTNDTEYSFE